MENNVMEIFGMKTLNLLLILQLIGIPAYSDAIVGQPYLIRCDQAMSTFGKRSDSDTVEKRFVEMAKTPSQMLQLMYDYKILFTEQFRKAFVIFLDEEVITNKNVFKNIRALRRLIELPDQELMAKIWTILDNSVALEADQKKDSEGQIAYLQAKNFIEAVKSSDHNILFQKLATIFIRDALVRFGNEYIEESHSQIDSRIERRNLGMLYGIFVSGGIFLMNHLCGPFNYGSLKDNLFMRADASFLGLMGGLFSGAMAMIGGDKWGISYADARRKYGFQADEQTSELIALDRLGHEVLLSGEQLLSKAEEEIERGFLPLDTICKTKTCELTPVQIAYLGHVDVLELKELNTDVKEAMKKVDLGPKLEKINQAARELKDAPHSYEKQISLELALKSHLSVVDKILQTQSTAAKTLIDYANTISTETLEALKRKPYKDKPSSTEELAKHNFFLAKVRADLDELAQIKVDSEALYARVSRTEQVVNKLKEILSRIPESPEGWADVAEEVLLHLDELK